MDLIQKLQLKPGMRVSVINPPDGFALTDIDVERAAAPGSLDGLLLFAGSVAELERLAPDALPLVKYDGLLWFAYPKKSGAIKTDITRDIGWDVVKQAGLQPVRQVAIDETWSALRFRPSAAVGK